MIMWKGTFSFSLSLLFLSPSPPLPLCPSHPLFPTSPAHFSSFPFCCSASWRVQGGRPSKRIIDPVRQAGQIIWKASGGLGRVDEVDTNRYK